MFFERDFWGTPVNLLLSSQKYQGVPFPQSDKNKVPFAAAPLVWTPFVRNQGGPGRGGGPGPRRAGEAARHGGPERAGYIIDIVLCYIVLPEVILL